MKPLTRYAGDFRWDGISLLQYKPEGDTFRDVTRQTLFGEAEGLACELRYFEVGPGGHTTLERHEHAHAVLVLRGEGGVLVGEDVLEVRPYDLVRVPPRTWHQFRASHGSALGFLCMVERERDRPARPGPEDLERLRARVEVARFIRTGA
jgi:quercetin dioxygenase-like cupin family protein